MRTEYLIAWVPPHLIPFAHAGIIVNPESCIEWLADRETPFTAELGAIGLLIWHDGGSDSASRTIR